MPGTDNESSTSLSVAPCFPSCCSDDCDVRRTLTAGMSCSVFRGDTIEGLLTGGGDLSLGEIGQRGVSLSSDVTDDFWGTGAFIMGSDATGCKFGMDAADNPR